MHQIVNWSWLMNLLRSQPVFSLIILYLQVTRSVTRLVLRTPLVTRIDTLSDTEDCDEDSQEFELEKIVKRPTRDLALMHDTH